MEKVSNLLVYEWNAWDGFLVSHLVGEDRRFRANYEDGPDDLGDAITDDVDAVLMQVNLSLPSAFPANRFALLRYFHSMALPVLNGNAVNITKRYLHGVLDRARIASAQADRSGDPDEMLFVKSNLNWGGEPEQRLPESAQANYPAEIACARIARHDGYYCARRKDIGVDVWSDDTVVVERYITNPEDSFYRVYGFGESVAVVKAHSDAQLKKICGSPRDTNATYSRREILSKDLGLPQDLQGVLARFLSQTSLQYFCLDIVHDLERAYIVDLNLTPYSGWSSQTARICQFLIDGFGEFLHQSKRARAG